VLWSRITLKFHVKASFLLNLIPFEIDFAGGEVSGWILCRIQKVLTLYMFVEQRITGIDRSSINGDADRAYFCLAINDDVAGSLIEAT